MADPLQDPPLFGVVSTNYSHYFAVSRPTPAVSEAGLAAWKTVQATSSQPAPETYTVKAGDTLSKIAKELLRDSNAYMEIFNLNRDQLSDPDKIKPGQVLRIPRMASR